MIRRSLLDNRHAQTLGGFFLRHPVAGPEWRRRRLELEDGDFVDLDELTPQGFRGGRRALLLHGLEGSSQSGYLRVTALRLARAGFAVSALNFRGCSGEPNRARRSYHAGETDDLAAVVRDLSRENTTLVAAGFSLGGNVLLKYLGERGESSGIARAAAVSVPYDLGACARALARGFSRVYGRHLLGSLKRKLAARRALLGPACDVERGLRAATFVEWDDAITAPLHGFGTAEVYFRACSSAQFVGDIRVPALLLQAVDDPFVPGETIPWVQARRNPRVQMDVRRVGGHVGFVGPGPRFEAEDAIVAHLRVA